MVEFPKAAAKAATELEERALRVLIDVCAACPERYMRAKGQDSVGVLWRDCVAQAYRSAVAVRALSNVMRQRANVGEPGPICLAMGDPALRRMLTAAFMVAGGQRGAKLDFT